MHKLDSAAVTVWARRVRGLWARAVWAYPHMRGPVWGRSFGTGAFALGQACKTGAVWLVSSALSLVFALSHTWHKLCIGLCRVLPTFLR